MTLPKDAIKQLREFVGLRETEGCLFRAAPSITEGYSDIRHVFVYAHESRKSELLFYRPIAPTKGFNRQPQRSEERLKARVDHANRLIANLGRLYNTKENK